MTEPKLIISQDNPEYQEAYQCGLRWGCYNQLTGQITIFLKDFINKEVFSQCGTNELNQFGTTDKVKQIARTIAHEYLHHILKQDHGYLASKKLDNLPNKIRNMYF